MSIFQGLLRKNHSNTQLTNQLLNRSVDITNIRNEISTLKRHVTLTNSRQRVSKKQRDILMTKVMNVLNKAEDALMRASSE